MERLTEISDRLIKTTGKRFIRSLYSQIRWSNRLIEIRGPRGVGKTTLMLQKAAELANSGNNVLYVSLDNAYFYKNTLFDLGDYFYKYGGKYLFVDEVHKYPEKEKGLDWSQEIKNLYDSYPGLNIVYSGSSILKLYKGSGDLSRRKAGYHLPGLSFREYLEFNNVKKFQAYDFERLIDHHQEISGEITRSVKVLPHFREYLKYGYYPFYEEARDRYFDRINEVVNVILESDIPAVSDINFEVAVRLKKMLSLLAASVPYTPRLNKLAEQLHIGDYRTLMKYLNFLEKADLIQTLSVKAKGNKIFNKPDKIFLNNTNLMYSIAQDQIDRGTLRETFILNQLSYRHVLTYPDRGDFLVDSKYVIEVGGRNKKAGQIAGIPDAYIAMDDVETGFANVIPLWLFGFTY